MRSRLGMRRSVGSVVPPLRLCASAGKLPRPFRPRKKGVLAQRRRARGERQGHSAPTPEAHKSLAPASSRSYFFTMKIATTPANGRSKAQPKTGILRMTRQLAEKRAVGDPKAPKFDGVAFLRTLKK